jgi:dTDP-4-dehydrorhamnose reductase
MRILITGAAGRLGGRLMDVLAGRGHEVSGVDVVEGYQPRLDVSDFAATRAFVGDLKPDLVIHPAAWTDVDGCARDPERAIIVNGFGAQNVALAAANVGAGVLYVSTNEVFDGKLSRPYMEYDAANPVNPYGYSKWVGEQAVQHVNPKHYIVRTAWLFAHGGKNFLRAVHEAAQSGKPLRIVTNEVANPTYNNDLAEAIASLIETGRYGIYHLTNEGACSRYQLARYYLDRVGCTDVPIEPIASHQWPRISKPPVYSGLTNLAARYLGITLRSWREAVDAYVAREGMVVK